MTTTAMVTAQPQIRRIAEDGSMHYRLYNQNVFTTVAFNHHMITLCKNHANNTLYYVLQLVSDLNIENLFLIK